MVVLVVLLTRRRGKFSVLESISLSTAIGLGLYLLDALALVRIGSNRVEHSGIDLGAEFRRIIFSNKENQMLMLFNTAVFVPFGIALEEYQLVLGQGMWRSLGRVALIGFELSLCVECLQLVFHVGIFELTDLALNTAGAVIGASLSLVIHSIIQLFVKTKAYG